MELGHKEELGFVQDPCPGSGSGPWHMCVPRAAPAGVAGVAHGCPGGGRDQAAARTPYALEDVITRRNVRTCISGILVVIRSTTRHGKSVRSHYGFGNARQPVSLDSRLIFFFFLRVKHVNPEQEKLTRNMLTN